MRDSYERIMYFLSNPRPLTLNPPVLQDMEKEVEDRKIELRIAERRREREPLP